jgi:hypothetical protein
MSDYLTLENLPNEIFEDIFDYFDVYELYKTFSRLNSRIQSIVSNLKYLPLTLYSPTHDDHPAERYFSSKIETVIVQHSSPFCDSKKFLSSQIRCLILGRPTREQWNSISPSVFPNLERLYLTNSSFVYRTEDLCRLIFSNGFPSLRTCSLPHISYEDNNRWTSSPSLQSLQIKIWDIRVYTQILNTCPNLNRFKIQLTGGNIQEKLTLCDSNKTHETLGYLAIYPSSPITCEFIDSILSFVPNLEYFLLNANYVRPSDVSIDTLASILEVRTSRLHRININIPLPDDFYRKEQIHTKSILFKSWKIQSELYRPERLVIVGSF